MFDHDDAGEARVELTVNGQETFEAVLPADDVVHLALHKLLPVTYRTNHRITVRKSGDLIYPDMFLYEIVAHYGDAKFDVIASPLDLQKECEFTNFGFDHLALALEDREAAKRFFVDGLRLAVVRDDSHITVVTSGNTALFLFDHDPNAPLAPSQSSQIHHLGFVVDDLEAAAAHLSRIHPEFVEDCTLLERAERWSLYGRIQFGTVSFLIQLSEIKQSFQGINTTTAVMAQSILYDYASRDYGVRLG